MGFDIETSMQDRNWQDFVACYHNDADFAEKVNADPAKALRRAGLPVPEGKKVKIAVDTKEVINIVLPTANEIDIQCDPQFTNQDKIIGKSGDIVCMGNELYSHRFGKLFREEDFKACLSSEHGSLDMTLMASADRSGIISFYNIKGLPEKNDLIIKMHDILKGNVSLTCESVESRRKLKSDNVRVQFYDEGNEAFTLKASTVTMTNEVSETEGQITHVGMFLSEFEYHEHHEWGKFGDLLKDFGRLHFWSTIDNSIKNRPSEDKKVTAGVVLWKLEESKQQWLSEATEIMQRLLSVMSFMHGGKVFCPITEVRYGSHIETTFFCNDESVPQFLPVIARGEDSNALISSLIGKIRSEDKKWKKIKDAIEFFLDAQRISVVSLFSSLAAIERLITSLGYGHKGGNFGEKINHYLQDKQLGSNGILAEDVLRLKTIRNDLAHKCVFKDKKGKKGKTRDLARYIAISREIFTRILLDFLDFDGHYVSFIDDEGEIGRAVKRKFQRKGRTIAIACENLDASDLAMLDYSNAWNRKLEDSIVHDDSIFRYSF